MLVHRIVVFVLAGSTNVRIDDVHIRTSYGAEQSALALRNPPLLPARSVASAHGVPPAAADTRAHGAQRVSARLWRVAAGWRVCGGGRGAPACGRTGSRRVDSVDDTVDAPVAQDEGVASVHEAVKQGINFFDCSPCVAEPVCFLPSPDVGQRSFYGDTRAERVLGRALKDIPRCQARSVLRMPCTLLSDAAVSLCCPPKWDATAPLTSTSARPASLRAWRHVLCMRSVCSLAEIRPQESLDRLCVDFIDIIQCHDIEFGSVQQVVEETLPGAQRLVLAELQAD